MPVREISIAVHPLPRWGRGWTAYIKLGHLEGEGRYVRYDRIFHLKYTASYPRSDIQDMVFFLPETGGIPLHFWLMSDAEAPILQIDDIYLKPRRITNSSPRWLDMGITTEVKGGFGQLRIMGMSPAQAARSFLVVTPRTDLEIGGKIEDVERTLWGISRQDAGSTVISPSHVTVGQPVSFTIRYFAGPKGLPPGSRIRFAVPLAFSEPQNEAPEREGFVSCKSPGGFPISIESIGRSEETHEAIDIICYLSKGLPPGEGIELNYRTERTYLFPCRFHEVDRRYWYSKLPPLSAAVAVDERRLFVSLTEGSGHMVEFVPGPAERLHLFLPGRRKYGKGLKLRGVFTDKYRNVPPSGKVAANIELFLVQGDEKIALGTPAGHFLERHRFEISLPNLKPGVYRAIALDAVTLETLAISNPLEILPRGSEEPEIYWGEIHGHTEMSDGCGGFVELYRHARHEGCLDFAAAADHACYFSDNEWQWMQDITNSWNRPGEFVTLVGYEWAGRQVHRNIYTSRDRLDLFRGMYPPTSSIQTVWEHFKDDETIVAGPHASLAHGLIWEFHEPSIERFVEVYSMWGASDSRDNPLAPVAISPKAISVDELLKGGAHLGFTGGGDCHEGHCGFSCEDPERQGKVPHTFALRLAYRCGMTAALLERLDRDSLIMALRQRKTYATTGARILLSFSVSGIAMGGLGRTDSAIVRASAHGCAPIKRMEIIKDGEVAFRKDGEGLDISIEWRDPEPPSREHFYYVRLIQQDSQMAWSSPVWVMPCCTGQTGSQI